MEDNDCTVDRGGTILVIYLSKRMTHKLWTIETELTWTERQTSHGVTKIGDFQTLQWHLASFSGFNQMSRLNVYNYGLYPHFCFREEGGRFLLRCNGVCYYSCFPSSISLHVSARSFKHSVGAPLKSRPPAIIRHVKPLLIKEMFLPSPSIKHTSNAPTGTQCHIIFIIHCSWERRRVGMWTGPSRTPT